MDLDWRGQCNLLTPPPALVSGLPFYLPSCLLFHSLSLRSLRSPGLKTGRLLSPCPAPAGLAGSPFHAPVDPDLGFWFKLREHLLSGFWLWLDFEMTRHPSFIFFGRPDLGSLTLPTHPECWRLVPNSKTFLAVFIYLFRCCTSAFMPKKSNLRFLTVHSLDKHVHARPLYLMKFSCTCWPEWKLTDSSPEDGPICGGQTSPPLHPKEGWSYPLK